MSSKKTDHEKEIDDLMSQILKVSGVLEPLQFAISRQLSINAFLSLRNNLLNISLLTYTLIKMSTTSSLDEFFTVRKELDKCIACLTELGEQLKDIVIDRQKQKQQVKH